MTERHQEKPERHQKELGRQPPETRHQHQEPMTDERLLGNIAERCQDCFALLFGRYFRSVLGIAFRILRDHAEAEDILQEVFLAIYLQQERFDPVKGSVRTWVLQFAYFKSLLRRRYLSIRKFYQQEELATAGELRAEVSFDRIFGLNAIDLASYVEAGLALLPVPQRQAIELIHFEGRTLQEVSELMRESLANTRNIYYRGMKRLRDHLQARKETETRAVAAGPVSPCH
jgi:RNA polymerase sigma-70 factor (ECF subfamily)